MVAPSALASPPFSSIDWVGGSHPDRGLAEAFVRGIYLERYSARPELMPHLLAFRGGDRQIAAVAGLRCGREGPLFVERYLGVPAEQRLQQLHHGAIARSQLVEFGNFAARSPGIARAVVLSLLPLLHDADVRWVLFVATRQLRNSFQRLGLRLHQLQAANACSLGAEAQLWGRYYRTQPMVVAGDLQAACVSSLALGACGLPRQGVPA